MNFPKSRSKLMLAAVVLAGALSACALKQNSFLLATPDQPKDQAGNPPKP